MGKTHRLKRIRLVIFDLDGTLVDAYAAIIDSFNHTMVKLRYPPQEALTIRRAVGWGDRNLLKPFVKAKDLGRALRIYRHHHASALRKDAFLYPGVEKLLVYLKNKGYVLAVASNRPSRFSMILIRHLRLGCYFDYVLCADSLKHPKPHPDIINKIIKRFSLKPANTLYVGDMAIDAQAGKRARVKTVIVATGSSTKKEIKRERPYRLIRGLGELSESL